MLDQQFCQTSLSSATSPYPLQPQFPNPRVPWKLKKENTDSKAQSPKILDSVGLEWGLGIFKI